MGHSGRVNDGNGGERVGRGEEGSGADPGEGRGRRGGREGERCEWERGPRERGRWRPYPLAGFTAGEGVRRRRAPFRPGRGNRKGTRGEERWAGPGSGVRGCGPVWAGGVRCRWATGPVGGGGRPAPFFLFLLCFCFLFSFYLLISFSVLFHLKVFRYFIKMCFLHHNYQCNISHPLNIFV